MMPIFSIIYRALRTPVKTFGLICPCLTQRLIHRPCFVRQLSTVCSVQYQIHMTLIHILYT